MLLLLSIYIILFLIFFKTLYYFYETGRPEWTKSGSMIKCRAGLKASPFLFQIIEINQYSKIQYTCVEGCRDPFLEDVK